MAITKASSSAVAPGAKGQLVVGSATNDSSILAVGANATVLTADSTEATGLKWVAPAAGGGMTLLSTTTLTGSSTAITSISGSYKNLYVEYEGFYCSETASMRLRPNGNTNNINFSTTKNIQGTNLATSGSVNLALDIPATLGDQNWGYFYINDYADSQHWKFIDNYSVMESTGGVDDVRIHPSYGYWRSTSAISSLTFLLSAGTFTAGTVRVYGVN